MGKYRLSFEEASAKLENFISYNAYRFSKISRIHESDDLKQIALMTTFKCLETYRLICPECEGKFGSISDYARHKCSGNFKEPKFTIQSYIKSRVLSAFQKEIKKETSLKRNPGVILPLEIDVNKNEDETFKTELSDVINKVLEKFEEQEKEIIRMLLLDYKQCEIIIDMEKRGSDIHFVRRTIRKFRQCISFYYDEKSLAVA